MGAIKKHIYKLLAITYKCVNLLEYSVYIEFDHLKDTIFESISSINDILLFNEQNDFDSAQRSARKAQIWVKN